MRALRQTLDDPADRSAARSAAPDEELVAALAGDPSALGVLYDRHAGLVYGLARSALGNTDEAADLTQEVFLDLYNRRSAYDPARGTLGAFLVTMTRSRAIDRLRSRGRKVRLLREHHRATPPAAPVSGAFEQVSQAECSARVRSALAALPAREREVLELAYFKGMTQAEIATSLREPLGTVKTWSRRGLLALKNALADLVG